MHHEQLEFPEEMFEPEPAAVNIRDAAAIRDSIPGFDFSVTDRIANPAPDAASAWIPEITGNRREGILAARDRGGFRASVAAAALVVTFGAGWFGGSHAQRLQHLAAALNPFAPVLDASPSSPPTPEAVAVAESPAKVTSTKAGPDTSGLKKLFDSAASTAYKPSAPRRASPAPSPVALVSPENAIAQAVAAQREEKDPPRLSAAPETRPGTIAGWTVRRVDGGTAVLEGPGGNVFQVRQGDTVPGVGRVDSIVLWGGRWIVSTATGLIATQ
jgi:hypothetical protein